MKSARIALAVGALVVMIATAACSSNTSNADETSTAVAKGGANATAASTKVSTSPTAGATPSAGAAQKQLTIIAQDFFFSADDISVSKGDTIAITFKNGGSATHTLAFYSDEAFKNPIANADTGNVSAGETKTLVVTADVGLFYRCNIHPTQMQGKIAFK